MKGLKLNLTLFFIAITTIFSFNAAAVVVHHGTTVKTRPAARPAARTTTTVKTRRVWEPAHYYKGTYVKGAYISVNCVHWVAGRYYHGKWVKGYCKD